MQRREKVWTDSSRIGAESVISEFLCEDTRVTV
jgi:hypothetical protein